MQLLELAIFAALAGVVLFQLYAVLGRRVGRQPEDAKPAARSAAGQRETPRAEEAAARSGDGKTAIEADANFDAPRFLEGAKLAYATIIKAYASNDREALEALTSPTVRGAFEQGMAAREAAGRTESVELLSPPRADLEDARVENGVARMRVRFLAEVRTRTRDVAGEAVDDRRTAEVWTFERPVNSRDPNWTLTRVDAAKH